MLVGLLLGSCKFAPGVPNGHIICQSGDDCPSGYTCEQVPTLDAGYSVCCKDKGCASRIGRDGQAPDIASDWSPPSDGQGVDLEAGTGPDSIDGLAALADALDTSGQPTEAPDSAIQDDAPSVSDPDSAPDLPSEPDADARADADARTLPEAGPDAIIPDVCGGERCTACPYATTPNGCCADTDCTTGGPGTAGQCSSSHSCSYACDSAHRSCNGTCIGNSACCTDSDCTSGPTGTRGTCDASSHACSYACDSTHRSCNGACIPTGSCCVDNDCTPVTLPNECQYQGCGTDNACGAKPKPNTAVCAGGAGRCDGAGSCLVCTAGQHRCNGTVLEVCNVQRTGFDVVHDCGSTSLCNPNGSSCYACVPSQHLCDSTNPHMAHTCSADGMTDTPETDQNKWCVNGELVQCRNVGDCTVPASSCSQATCNGNVCGTASASAGTSCAGNGSCDGGGRCTGPVGRSCTGGTTLSCQGVSASGAAQTVSCCQSMLVGGTFPLGRGSNDACPTSMNCDALDTPEHTASVSPYYLDAFEVTVGRFRKFYSQYSGPYVAPGAGQNPHIPNSGWDSSWNSYLPSNATTLLANIVNCSNSSWPATGDPNPPDPEQRPVNCVTWYEAFAFCVWDQGRLPTEAEWEYAAAGGDANTFYPWGPYNSGVTTLPVNYYGNLHSQKVSVGSVPGGVGRFGQLDLLGSVAEWVLDGIGNYGSSACNDCADLSSADIAYRGLRGGSWTSNNLANLRSTARKADDPAARSSNYGIRCAHDKN